MHAHLGGGVEVAVAAVQTVVKFADGRIRSDGTPRERPIGFRGNQFGSDGGHQRIAIAGADCLFRHRLLSASYVADDLGPQSTLGSTAYGDQPLNRSEVTVQELEDLPDAESDAFVNGPEQVTAFVAQSQAGDHAPRSGVEDRCPFAGAVWQQQQAA